MLEQTKRISRLAFAWKPIELADFLREPLIFDGQGGRGDLTEAHITEITVTGVPSPDAEGP